MAHRSPLRLPAAALLAALLAAGPAHASLERAQAAQARGDLRAAQIELRNAVRDRPNDAALRAALARASLDVGDGDTAEKEARAALERGFDRVQGTALLLRAYIALGRTRDLLRDFPVPADPAQAVLAGRIAAARALAQLALDDRAAAKDSAAQAVRLAPGAAEPHIAAAVIALSEGDAAAADAALDKALAAEPDNEEALLRKAALALGRGDAAGVATLAGRVIARAPGNVPARLLRAEALMRTPEKDAEARADVEAALRTQPGSAPANYLRGVLLLRARDWRAADEVFTRLGPVLGNFPDGFLFAAAAKQQLGQAAQAEDLARRHVARRPEDPRGAKLLAQLEMSGNRPDAAAGTLQRLADRGTADAEALDMLGRAQLAAGRPREAAAALQRASVLAPGNAGILARLAAARLAAGDPAGMAEAAQGSLAIAPNQASAREMLAAGALTQGDLAAAEAELARLAPAARQAESGLLLEGTVRLGRLDPAGARTSFEAALRLNPNSVGARLGLVRAFAAQGDLAAVDREIAEVLRRAPTNGEALQRAAAIATAGGPRAAGALAMLEAARGAAPTEAGPALALASAMAAAGEMARAAELLEAEPLRTPGRGAALPLARSQAYAALERWQDAEQAARAALAEDPRSSVARRQLALLMARNGNMRGAETLMQDGLRQQPSDVVLQTTLVGLVQQARGFDAALAVAEQLARTQAAQPTSRSLPGDLLLSAQRPADAARAFAAAYAEAPSAALAVRQALAWRAAGQAGPATSALEDWLAREPDSAEALDVLAQLDMSAGRIEPAMRRLRRVVELNPANAVASNHLAGLIAEREGATPEARALAERAYFLMPNAETADTLGWIVARGGDAQRALPLLRLAAAAPRGAQGPDPAKAYRLAWALRAAGDRAEAMRVLESALAGNAAFAERPEAERLMAELRAGR
jgi:putative PEP-CTERM system TPR-repeat lipoprotein